jgi:hypothetical protein
MKHRFLHGLVALSVIALAACGDTAGPDGTESQFDALLTLDVAMVSADAVVSDVADHRARHGAGMGGFVFPPPDDVGTVTYFDAAGNEQEAYDEVTTASIHVLHEGTHARGRENWIGTVTRTRDMTITGLEGDETTRTVNGTGSSTVSRSRHSDENGDRSWDMTGSSVISDVVHGVPHEENPYPLSGTITRDMTAVIVNGPNGDETRTRHVVITFNGTQLVTMTVDDESFEVDLSTRDGRHPFRRHGR